MVVPNANATVEGSGKWTILQGSKLRYQSVFAASEIGGAGTLDKLVFRRDRTQGAFGTVIGDLKFTLSHTS